MHNPHAPTGHMNVRMLEVGKHFWFGGGADLTPFISYGEDKDEFHAALQQVCDDYRQGAYAAFSKRCDEYFYIKHRNSSRGVGGIFFDKLTGNFDELLSYVESVARAYIKIYAKIIERRKEHSFTSQQREDFLFWRGRYVEFNLVYDVGTRFGLLTGGNIEAIMVSLPPTVKW